MSVPREPSGYWSPASSSLSADGAARSARNGPTGTIRHPSYKGLRHDKDPREVIRELPAADS